MERTPGVNERVPGSMSAAGMVKPRTYHHSKAVGLSCMCIYDRAPPVL
jgi:hypothetical protein